MVLLASSLEGWFPGWLVLTACGPTRDRIFDQSLISLIQHPYFLPLVFSLHIRLKVGLVYCRHKPAILARRHQADQ